MPMDMSERGEAFLFSSEKMPDEFHRVTSRAGESKEEAIQLAPIKIPLPSRVMCACWYILTYLLLSPGLVLNVILISGVLLWSSGEIYWRWVWYWQSNRFTSLFSELSSPRMELNLRYETVRQLQIVVKDITSTTLQSPLRCILESLVLNTGTWFLFQGIGSLWSLIMLWYWNDGLLDQSFVIKEFSNQAIEYNSTNAWFSSLKSLNSNFIKQCAHVLICLGVSAFLWLQVKSSLRKRYNHRLLMARMGAADIFVELLLRTEASRPLPDGEADGNPVQDVALDSNRLHPNGQNLNDVNVDASYNHLDSFSDRRENLCDSLKQASSNILALVACTSDSTNDSFFRLSSVRNLFALLSTDSCDLTAKENITIALQELLSGRNPSLVLLSIIGSLDTDVDPREQLKTLQSFVSVLPKQCSTRVRQAVSKTGLIGALLKLVQQPSEKQACYEPPNPSSPPDPSNANDTHDGGHSASQRATHKAEVLASNMLVRLATQMEWESDKTPLFDEVAGRLCSCIIDDPTGPEAERAAVLLAVLANTLGNTLAYMRLYETSAETMPLRLEQVRIDLRRMSTDLMMNRSSQSLMQTKSQHFMQLAVPALSALLVADSSETAKSAAALCIALLCLQRPNICIPRAVIESIVKMLHASDWAFANAAEALAAIGGSRSLERVLHDQGVVETLILKIRTGSNECKASAASALECLVRRRRFFRECCKRAGAVEVLHELESSGQASVREAASSALMSLNQSFLDDLLAACSSTGYFFLVVFCFFVQLGGVHAVIDLIEIFSDILHVLSKITAVRKQLHSPTAAAIVWDFIVNDPVALLLILLVCLVPIAVVVYLLRRRFRHCDSVKLPQSKQHLFMTHRSWLLGISFRQELVGGSVRYVITEAMPDGPCRHSVQVGDELLCIDGVQVQNLSLDLVLKLAYGDPKLSLAQRVAEYVWGCWGGDVPKRCGRGSRTHLRLLRKRKDGRRCSKDVWLVRGKWEGMSYSDASAKLSVGDAQEEEAAGLDEQVPVEEEDERVCRICQCTEEEAPEQGKLFSPCHCKGTMRYIHEKCLDTWRRMSFNASSHVQCDQCFYAYRVERRGLANFVRRRGVVEVVSFSLFLLGVFLTGFVVKWGKLAWELPLADGGKSTGLADMYAIDRQHFILGCTGVGVLGFSTLVILLPMRGFGFIGYHPNLFRGNPRGDSSASLVLGIVVVAGMLRALFLAYKLTQHMAASIAERSGTVILPADHSRSPGRWRGRRRGAWRG